MSKLTAYFYRSTAEMIHTMSR